VDGARMALACGVDALDGEAAGEHESTVTRERRPQPSGIAPPAPK
jgi:hypothetical protein